MTRFHLASLVDDFRAHSTETAVVTHRGVRSDRTTYGDLANLIGCFAAELNRRGIGPGERVLLWADNSAAWIAVFFGCLLRGVLVVPLDAAGSTEFAFRVLADVAPRLVVGDPQRLLALQAATAERGIPTLPLPSLQAALPAQPDFRVDPSVQPDTPFQIIFTSGTTSEPKGIVHTHRNVLASLSPIESEIAKYRRYERLVHPLRFLHTLPLSHVFGQFMGLWIPGVLAAELHVTDALDAGRILSLLRRERISVLVAVPRVLSLLRAFLLAEQPALLRALDASAGLPTLKRWWRFRAIHRRFGWKFWAVISGGASLPTELEQFWNRLGFALVQGYGLTETAALVTLNHPFRVGQGTLGKALPGREVRLSDTGELLVRGDMVATSTWRNGRLEPREEEWLATGDLVAQNDAGEFRFLGRQGDAIVTSSGLNIHPGDLETAMLRQPGMQACAVVPCELATGPEPVAVVLFQGEDAALNAAVQAANTTLAGFQQVRRVLRWPELTFPYTSTGKLLRRRIREWACQALMNGTARDPAAGDMLLELIASVTGEAVPGTGERNAMCLSEDLHLDSLARVQLASVIEQRTGVLLSDAAMASMGTLSELRQAIAASLGTAASDQQTMSPAVHAGRDEFPAEIATQSEPAQNRVTTATAETHRGVRDSSLQAVYPHWPWFAPVRWMRAVFLEALLRPLISSLLAPRVALAAQPPTGPMLLIANHVTMLDAALVLYALPAPLRRRVAVMMWGEMLLGFRSGKRAGVAGRAAYWLLTALFNVFSLPQLQGFRHSFAHAGEALDRGMSVLIFPEGARSKTGALAPFRSGIGLLAAQAGAPVLPIALIGLDRVRAKDARWFRSGALEVRVGEALAWAPERSPEAWTAELQARLSALLNSES